MAARKVFTLAALLAMLAGCGSSGSSTVSPAAYAKSLCSAVGPFERDVISSISSLNLNPHASPAQGKTVLQGFLTRLANDTDSAVSQLKAAGTPNVSDGKQIADTINGAFSQIDAVMKKAATQASQLPTSSPQAFRTAVQALVTNVRASMTSIGANLQSSTLRSPQLTAAAAKEPTCKTLATP
jgi:hypothetical protein